MTIAAPPSWAVSSPNATQRRVLVAVCASAAIHAAVALGVFQYGAHALNTGGAGTAFNGAGGALATLPTIPAMAQTMLLRPEEQSVTAPPPQPQTTPPPHTSLTDPEELAQASPMGPVPPLEIEAQPGIDDSTADTPNWLGEAQGTEHKARQSTTDQPALSRDPGSRGSPSETPGVPTPPQPSDGAGGAGGEGSGDGSGKGDGSAAEEQSATAGTETDQKAPSQQVEEIAPQLTQPPAPAQLEQPVPAQVPPAPPKPEDTTGLMPEQEPLPPTPVDQPPTAAPTVPLVPQAPAELVHPAVSGVPATPATGGSSATPVPTGSESKTPGKSADAESPATSREISMTFKPGTPAAREGLRLRPRLPRFTMTTRATARPNNPLVIMKFNRAGKVVKAEFAPNRTTGSEDWDGPLMASLYEWTATGKKLLELPANDPNAVLVVRIEYLLRD